MTQLASNTLAYDQIYFKIRDFFLKTRNKEFKTLEDQTEAYGKLLRDVYQNIGSPIAEFDPFIKGEPLRSEKMNIFSTGYADDLNVIGKQIDYLAAKTVSVFNMFFSEIENEKKYLERIGSKLKVLQMYSKSTSNDLFYFGDSFDNMDKIDVSLIRDRYYPLVSNGQCTFSLASSRSLSSRKITINKTEGFLGNSHKVIKSINPEGTSFYKYVFEDIPTIGSLNGISDSNPLTFVEFEALNVDKSSLSIGNNLLVSDSEFSYIYNDPLSSGNLEGSLVNWSEFDMTKPLTVSYSIELASAKANCIEIVPYFGSVNIVKVPKVVFTRKDGTTFDILKQPIYIGSSFVPANLEAAKNYFYNKAVLRFTEQNVVKVEVFFEQEQIENIEIGHVYWRPNYPVDVVSDSPFYGLERFNPDSLSKEIYEEIEYDRNQLIPRSNVPTEFKTNGSTTQTVRVRLKTRPTVKEFWVLTFLKDLVNDGRNVDIKSYFMDWVTDIDSPEDGFSFSTTVTYRNSELNVKSYSSEIEGQTDLIALQEWIEENDGVLEINSFNYEFTDVKLEKLSFTDAGLVSVYDVPVISVREILPAKRKSVGIRDISVLYETYSNQAEVVSKPFYYDKPVESLMLSVDSNVDNTFSDKINMNYYISVNEGTWIPVSPVQLDNRGIAEVIVFNKNVSDSAKLPGVAYLNYPEVPKEIKKVFVRIEMFKKKDYNITPILYSYELIAKVIS